MAPLDPRSCYRALLTHDARFDGCFFTGVTSTHIYCRPICTVKTPKPENCLFFPSAAAAELKGFRPCLRCRPELAPGNSSFESASRLTLAAAKLLEEGYLEERHLPQLAERLGVSDRHLRRSFKSELGVPLIAYAQTQRLLMAKRLLTDTNLPITEVALTSGFASLRRFNAAFKEHYRLKPSEIRKHVIDRAASEAFRLEIAYRPPYDWESLLAFLEGRTITGAEQVEAGTYRRNVRLTARENTYCGWIAVTAAARRPVLQVALSPSLAPVIPAVLARVKRLFDVGCDPAQVLVVLGPTLCTAPGLRVPGAFDGYEMAVRAILGQQVSVKAARTLAGRFTARFGDAYPTPFVSLTHLFPAASEVSKVAPEDLRALGITGPRAVSLIALSKAVASKKVRLDASADIPATLEALRELPGIGEWTAQYIAMRALAWPDAFPHTDLGIKHALGETSPKKILEKAEAWRPWRAYATLHLWQSLSSKKESK